LIGALPIIEAYTDSFAWILIIHHSIGLVAFVLSLFLVARFAYARFTVKLCCGKWLMRTTAVLWGIALVLGLYLYLSGYIV
jgi:uncharacterized membrane protein YozB (DUF420 family)